MRVGVEEVTHFLSANRSSMLNQGISATQGEYGQTPALFSMGLLRRNCAGLGFKNKAVAKQNLALAKNWSSVGYDSKFCQLFTWNAGNLSRRALNDTVDDIVCQPFTLGMTQEASTECVQLKLYDARGIQNLSSSDTSIMCSSGGSGNKMLRKVYDETTNVYADWIPRPAFYNRGAPFLDCEEILMLEQVELHSRVRAGTSYGRTQLPRDLLNRALEQ